MNNRIPKVILAIFLVCIEANCADVSTKQPSITSTSKSTATDQQTLDPVLVEMQAGMDIGNEIISAIEAHHQATGAYPRDLSDLVPEFLVEIPITTTGQVYQYVLYGTEAPPDWHYMLYFDGENGKWGCAYHPEDDIWECGRNRAP